MKPATLSPRRAEVLKLIALGLTEKQIAQCLQLSPSTVQEHKRAVYSIVGVHCSAHAALYAMRTGLVTPDEADAVLERAGARAIASAPECRDELEAAAIRQRLKAATRKALLP